MRRYFSFLLLLVFLQSCGSNSSRQVVRVGIDSTWYPFDFGEETSYVNGFVEELLLEISKGSSLEFEWIAANTDSLYEEMQKGLYKIVLGSKERYDFNLALYDFSNDVLQLGPVLIVPALMKIEHLEEMEGKWVGALEEDPAIGVLQQYPSIFPRAVYRSIPELLNGIKLGEIDGALLDFFPAVQYVGDLFKGELRIAIAPLTPAGIRFIALKNDPLIFQFNRELHRLEKKKILQKLLAKWGLAMGL